MKKVYAAISIIIVGFASLFCHAGDNGAITYSKEKRVIIYKSPTESASVPFRETESAGNSVYSFTHFGGFPAVAHDSNSLDSYTAYATLEYKEKKLYIGCVYVDFKSNQNGLSSKQGYCGLNTVLPDGVDSNESVIDNITEGLINNSDAIDTSILIKNKVMNLPVLLYRDKLRYIFRLYNKDDLINGTNKLVSCSVSSSRCDVYDSNTWVIQTSSLEGVVDFKKIEHERNKKTLVAAKPQTTVDIKLLQWKPLSVTSDKAYFYNSKRSKLKSYLIKYDKINLLSVSDDGNWCQIRYISDKNKAIDAGMLCSDLSI